MLSSRSFSNGVLAPMWSSAAACATVLALAAIRVDAQLGPQSPLSIIPPSYAQSCTTLNEDGSYSPDPSLCPSSLACTKDPYRMGAYYCGIGGSPCASGANCAVDGIDAACQSGKCTGGYGEPLFTYSPDPYHLYQGCLRSLRKDIYGNCGGDGAKCGSAAACASGTCASGRCVERVTTIGGSCDPSQPYACGSSGNTRLFCRASDSTCQPLLQTGDVCDATYACTPPAYCGPASASAGSQHTCLEPVNVAGGSCEADPMSQCGTDVFGHSLFCQGVGSPASAQGATCQPVGTSPFSSCYNDLSGNACASGLYCTGSTAAVGSKNQCMYKVTTVGNSCSFDPTNGCGTGLYCRSSDQTCQLRLTTVGADCSADPVSSCTVATAADGTTTPLYCSLPSYQCAAKIGPGASCASNPALACQSPYYCSSNNDVCIARATGQGSLCNGDPYTQCGSNGDLFPLISTDTRGNQFCECYIGGPFYPAPPPGAFGVTTVGGDCSADPTFACGYSATGVKLYCALSTNTCQPHVTEVGGSCAYDYLGACGVTAQGTQLYPSIPIGSSGHADCTCVTQVAVGARPSSRARARARVRRNLSLCPGSQTACSVGSGFECIDTQNNIEQCGGCAHNGGTDCTALPGVAAVGCVAGRCETWACDPDRVYDATHGECVHVDS